MGPALWIDRRAVLGRLAKTTSLLLFGIVVCAPTRAAGPTVVINEVHYHPADDTREGEFVELYNYGDDPVDLSGWNLEGGVNFLFPLGTVLGPGEYLVVAADAGTLVERYGLDQGLIAGSYVRTLSNGGELLRLWSSGRYIVSFVHYGDSDPWPETPDGLGPSLERVSPLREDTDPQAWAPSILVGGTPGGRNTVDVDERGPLIGETRELILPGSEWRFFRGVEEPPADWTELGFEDGAWESGPAGFGYGDDDDATVLEDMDGSYLTVYVRRSFEVEDPSRFAALTLLVDYDDGFVAYLNGTEIARQNVETGAFDEPTTANHEAGVFEQFPVSNPGAILQNGTNVLAVQGHNGGLGSSDFSLSPALEGTLRPEEEPPPPVEWARPARDLVINELSAGGEGTGWVELYNPTTNSVDASGRRLSLYPPALGAYNLPAGSEVPARATLVVGESELGFELDAIHALLLTTDDRRAIDAFNPRTTESGRSTGRFPDGAENRCVFSEPSPGEPNAFDLDQPVVINEIQYHPSGANLGGEYIEVFNRSDAPVDVSGWSFTRGVLFTMPAETTIPPGGYRVVASDPRALEEYYGIAEVLGPYDGRLDNDAETLLLRDALGNPVDRVRYADEGSWPESTDGEGPSIELVHPDLENRYGPAWAASDGEGTPGAVNSRFDPDPGPIVVGVQHEPVIPVPSEAVRVLARISDEQGIESAVLYYEVDGSGGEPERVVMVDDGVGDDGVASNGTYGADIPPQSEFSIVAFWIQAEAEGGQTVTVPSGAPEPAFLYQVEDGRLEGLRPLYRLIMRSRALNSLRTRGVGSDNLLDLTFVANGRAYYNRGIRYRGSSARGCNPLSYRIQFDHDRDLHGIKRLNLNGCGPDRQWIGLDFLRRTGIPAPLAWFRRLSINGALENNWHLRVEAIDDAFLERVFPEDADGNLYRGIGQANLDYRGDDAGDYRGNYRKGTNEQAGDYSDVMDLCFRFDRATTSDEDFPQAIEERVDTSQWTLYFAAFAILGSTENSILLNNGDDYFLYHRFSDDRWILLPWDLDSCFNEEDQTLFRPTVDAIERLLEHSLYAPDYWCHLESLLEIAFESDLVNSRIDHLAPLFSRARVQEFRTYAVERRDYISQRVSAKLEVEAGAGGVVCRGILYPSWPAVQLNGQAPSCGTVDVLVNGAPVSYDPLTNLWSGAVDVSDLEMVEVAALDRDAVEISRLELYVDEIVEEEVSGIHEQQEGAGSIAIKAVNYDAITDPNGDGFVWQEVAVNGAVGNDTRVLKAPDGGDFRAPNQSLAVYTVRFRTPGSYRGYYRARGFTSNTDSVFRPTGFGLDPDVHLRTSGNGEFAWVSEGEFNVTQQDVDDGVVLEIRIGVREFETEFDALVLSLDAGLRPAELNALFDGASRSSRVPRARLEVIPSTEVTLKDGTASVILDGSSSHNGQCSADGLSFSWDKLEGPAGDEFRSDVTGSAVQVVFSEAGTYRYRLSVTNDPPNEASDSEDVTVTVMPPVANGFLRCDSNGDGTATISDAVFTLLMLFSGGTDPACAAAADCDADGGVNITDAIFELDFLFLGGPLPGPPYPNCDAAPVEECAIATCAP